MNQAEKEQYLREYAIFKAKGKPFYPYAVAKDSIMAAIVVLLIAFLSLMFGAELGPKADPTTTTYVPRPEWYFFFLFELLRIIKPAVLTPLATIGIPTICMVLLLLLPFVHSGNDGPGPDLTDIGATLPRAAILRTLENPTAPMPSFAGMPEDKKNAMVDFLS